jgi:apolipoprotein D and lipocalin family protein
MVIPSRKLLKRFWFNLDGFIFLIFSVIFYLISYNKVFQMRCFLLIFFNLFFFNVRAQAPLNTVDSVDLNRYAGLWYEMARLPQSFQKGCVCTTAEYLATETPGKIIVLNSCRENTPNGKLKNAKGVAMVQDGSNNSKLKVRFFWPFSGKYWIIDLADDYSYAMVGHPNRKYLWILSRTPQIDKVLLNSIIQKAENKGFNVANLIVSDNIDCK